MKHATTIRLTADYIDLGLPSGTLWATKNLTIGKRKHFDHYEAVLLKQMDDSLELPSREDFKELIVNCTWKWVRLFGKIPGYKVIGPNGKSIFLSALGYYCGTHLDNIGGGGYYWSRDFFSEPSAYCLYFCNNFKSIGYRYRSYSQSVRAVKHITKHK